MNRYRIRGVASAAALGVAGAAMVGCQLVGFIAQGYEETVPRTVYAEYLGLDGKSFAVVVATSRATEADYPGVGPALTLSISEDLAKNTKATDYARPDLVLSKLDRTPGWIAKPRGQLAADLGVERLVFIEISEYRLHVPGNRYEWDGRLAGRVAVYEVDAMSPDDPVYEKALQVAYPDKSGYGEDDMAGAAVGTMLVRRFRDRVSWLFYTHEEARNIEY